MRWIPLFALAASCAVPLPAAEYGNAPAATPAAETTDAPAAEDAPELEGVVVERANGGYITLAVEEKKLVVRFFDKKKKPVALDVRGGFVRFRFPNRDPERRPLIPRDDGTSLTHGEPVQPPYVFKAYITLRQEGLEDADVEASEQYVVDFP
jgi:hypothetical protein